MQMLILGIKKMPKGRERQGGKAFQGWKHLKLEFFWWGQRGKWPFLLHYRWFCFLCLLKVWECYKSPAFHSQHNSRIFLQWEWPYSSLCQCWIQWIDKSIIISERFCVCSGGRRKNSTPHPPPMIIALISFPSFNSRDWEQQDQCISCSKTPSSSLHSIPLDDGEAK